MMRTEARDLITRNIQAHGFHSYTVSGGGVPRYCYTIGLSPVIGAEVILAGAYFYRFNDAPEVVRGVAQELLRTPAWPAKTISLEPLGVFSFRRVEVGWARSLMLGVSDYYREDNIPAYQIVPDDLHRTIEIPDLGFAYGPETAPGWRWLHEEWVYPIPRLSAGITNLEALRGARITEVVRWEEDEWELFAGAGPDVPEEDIRVVPLGILLGSDNSLEPITALTVGSGLWREGLSGWHPWQVPES